MLHGAECDDAVCCMVLSVMMLSAASVAECDDAVCCVVLSVMMLCAVLLLSVMMLCASWY